MKRVIVVGNGISGLCSAIYAAKKGISVTVISPTVSERSQSVMAAGGINGALNTMGENDSVSLHIADTVNGGCGIENEDSVTSLCNDAPEIIHELESFGVPFNRLPSGECALRAFGGQSKKRTAYAGSSTGKQIVSALVRVLRKYESNGLVRQIYNTHFLSALLHDGECFGIAAFNDRTGKVEEYLADAVIMATGGQNRIFGKTTGSMLCDGSAAAKLFMQGALLRNPEFIQYHPTTIETPGKRMLISEAVRGEGGRLFYLKNGEKCWFMEEKYGTNGNLMPRDIVSKEIYDIPSQVYLDMTFLDKKVIGERLAEVRDLCRDYLNWDVSKEPIPVYPSVHFFMGGLAVDPSHQTSISRIYAVGECASAYHGANRLGGNSLLAAIHSAKTAVEACGKLEPLPRLPNNAFSDVLVSETEKICRIAGSKSKFPTVYIMEELARVMNKNLGITRTEQRLKEGIEDIRFLRETLEKLSFDGTLSPYECYALPSMLVLAETVTRSALERRETRGAHIRSDYPVEDPSLAHPTYASFENGEIRTWIGERGNG